ncbi:aldo/keto reductase [Pseudacidobacterium ailaaui]|uniref:aldo/keto reductase n=1 Tax=Pseudacidobacterium ailaaui TaxID=1382359 RepID=UPI00047C5ECB|nr:aldo/keto reductase [Pseudacidobacterium ailaaui]
MEQFLLNNQPVSRIGLGTWAIGGSEWGDVPEKDAIATCLTALDCGIRLIDTAPIYGHGRAEEIVGKAIRQHGKRDTFYVATKAGLEWNESGVYANATPARLRRELEDSLRRLRTDYIDLYQIHWPDTLVPVEEPAAVMREFYEEGKIRAIGVSNFSAAQMRVFSEAAPLHSNQPPYNIFEREIEHTVVPWCREHTVALIVYSPLCRSLLAGRLTASTEFPVGDIRRVDPKFQQPRYEQYLNAVALLDKFAQENYGKRVLHLAMRWVLDRPGISAALWGAKRPEQLSPVREVLGWKLDDAAMAAIEDIVRECVLDPAGPEYLAPRVRGL